MSKFNKLFNNIINEAEESNSINSDGQSFALDIYLQRNSSASKQKQKIMQKLQEDLSSEEKVQAVTKDYAQDSVPVGYQAPSVEAYKDTLTNGSSMLELTINFSDRRTPLSAHYQEGVIRDVLRAQGFKSFFLTQL